MTDMTVTDVHSGQEMAIAGDALDGVRRRDRALALWQPPLVSADQETSVRARDVTQARVRDARTSDAFISAAEGFTKDSVVGARYMLNAKPEYKALGLDETWATEFQEEIETKWALYAESPEAYMDASRYHTFTESIRLALGVFCAAGEYLETIEWVEGRPYKTAFQPVELERLCNPPSAIPSVKFRSGIEKDRYGAPIAYHIRMGHPSDPTDMQKMSWKRVKARKPWGRLNVIHVVDRNLINQTRGISDLVAGMSEMHILKQLRGVTLQNAIINATYAATIESEMPSEAVFAALGANKGDIGGLIADYGEAYLGAIANYVSGSKNMQIDGARIAHLFPGTKLKMQPASSGNGVLGEDFEKSLLRYLAALTGLSYEELARDYSDSNYSSIRAAMAQTQRRMLTRKAFVADRVANLRYRAWLEEMLNRTGEITSMPKNAPSYYEGINADAYAAATWIGASAGQIDELKETQAAVLRIQNNLSTAEQEVARLGGDWRKIYGQRRRERDIETEYELPHAGETSPMGNAASPDDPKAGDGGSSDSTNGNDSGNGGKRPARKRTSK